MSKVLIDNMENTTMTTSNYVFKKYPEKLVNKINSCIREAEMERPTPEPYPCEAPLNYVNPFIGVDGPGAVLCGPYTPLALVRLSPDTIPMQRTNGYQTDKPLQGFSHTHVSGTGGDGRFGNISLTPFINNNTNDDIINGNVDKLKYERKSEHASIGYYTVKLIPSHIRVELTSSTRGGFSRFTFPKNHQDQNNNILIDISAIHAPAKCKNANVEWDSDQSFFGSGTFYGGWGHQFDYNIYCYGMIDKKPSMIYCTNNKSTNRARDNKTFLSGLQNWMGGTTTASYVENSTYTSGSICKTIAQFKSVGEHSSNNVINIRVGISFVSIAAARESMESQLLNQSFDTIIQSSRLKWKTYFDRIRIMKGGTKQQRKIFYTFLTRILCMPSDLGIDEENGKWKSGVRHFSEFYCVWDSVRNANSFITLFAPELERDFLNCWLDVAEKTGFFKDAWITGHGAHVQGGCSCDILFNEAYLKGLKNIDYEKALSYMEKNNKVAPPDPFLSGRYLKGYSKLGYVPTEETINCVSRHLEYAYQDWCTGNLAQLLGKEKLAQFSYESSRKVWNLWREDMKVFAPKNENGEWIQDFHPLQTLPDAWNDPFFYEGPSILWSYNVQHDFHGLVQRSGGEKEFEKRLDVLFSDKFRITPKETFMHIPYLYHYAKCPNKSSYTARALLDLAYDTSRIGLPDNEDMGCHSANYMCGMIGLYPMMGQDWYFIIAPSFQEIIMSTSSFGGEKNGKSDGNLIILAPNASMDHHYIKSMKLNGKLYNKSWIRHKDIVTGGDVILEFELTSDIEEAGNWGIESAAPPSPMKIKS